MRNTMEYPITVEECKRHITAYGQRELDSGMLGGTGPYITKLVVEFLDEYPIAFAEFLEFKHRKDHGI